jgi:hypothetical protein
MTDTPVRRRGPLLTLSGLEWKLMLTALLSTIYAFSFVAVARPAAPAPTAGTQSAPVAVVSKLQPDPVAPATVTRSTVAPAPAPRAVQPRVRTRSS